MREIELRDESFQRTRLFERIEVLALNVLDERDRDRCLVGNVPDDGRDLPQPRHLCRPPAALTRDDLVALCLAGSGRSDRPDHDRLHHALRLDGVGQLLQRFRPHVHPGLVAAPLQQIERQLRQLLARRGNCGRRGGRCRGNLGHVRRGPAEQVSQTATERGLLLHHGERS